VRQRRNAAAALARGVEFNARKSIGDWQGEIGYLFADSRFVTGERIPQVPRHQGTAQLTYQHKGTLASAGVRSYGMQFEDDLNQFRLAGFASVQLVVRQHIAKSLSALASIENLLDRQYSVGFSPTPLIGPPRLWRIGLRWDGPVR
jgi:outer membrane receptor protein involved in Fe transport